MDYSRDKYYSYEFVKQRTKNVPAYMRSEIEKLKPKSVKNSSGKMISGVRISQRLHEYLFNNKW